MAGISVSFGTNSSALLSGVRPAGETTTVTMPNLAAADARARAGQRVCARRGVPYADTAAVARGYEGGPVVGLGNTVDGAGVDAG